jgi:hypothetical protein
MTRWFEGELGALRLACAIFAFHFALSLCASGAALGLGDSAELAAVGGTLGIAHAPGYPLYAILGRIAVAVFPFATDAFRMTLFSVLCSAAAVALGAWVLVRISGQMSAAASMALAWSAAPFWMAQSTSAEVFGLNSLFASALLALCIWPKSADAADVRRLRLAGFLLGLGLANNHTLVLLAPALLVAFWSVIRTRPKELLITAACAAAALSVYAFIPIRSAQLPLMDWEEPRTLERFWKLVTRARYGTFQLAQGEGSPWSAEHVTQAVRFSIGAFLENAQWLAAGLAAFVFARPSPAIRRAALIALVGFVFTGPVFLTMTQLKPTAQTRFILDRFFYLPLVPAFLLIGLGFCALMAKWTARNVRLGAAFSLLSLSLLPAFFVDRWQRSDYLLWDLSMALLRNTPVNARLFADRADEAEFGLAYMQRVQGFRGDVLFVDCNAGVSRSIYGPDYYDIWGRPRLVLRTAREKQLIAEGGRAVYYATHEPGMIEIPRVPEGLLYRVPSTAPAAGGAWDQLLTVRPRRTRDGRLPTWERHLHANVLERLGAAALQRGDRAHGKLLYRGVFAYTGPSLWRDQMQRHLDAL